MRQSNTLNLDSSNHILEEILDLSRTNQKLLRNPEGVLEKDLVSIKENVSEIFKMTRMPLNTPRRIRQCNFLRVITKLQDDLFSLRNSYVCIQMILSLLKDDFPWLYDSGIDLIRLFKSEVSLEAKRTALDEYDNVLEFTFKNPMIEVLFDYDRDTMMPYTELPLMLIRMFKESLDDGLLPF